MRHHINHVPKSSMRSLLKDPIDGGMGPVKELSPVHVYVCMNMYVHNIFRDRQRSYICQNKNSSILISRHDNFIIIRILELPSCCFQPCNTYLKQMMTTTLAQQTL